VGVVVLALTVESRARAGDGDFAVYENWRTSEHIRGDRWGGIANPAQDTEKEQRGHRAHLRIRREGFPGMDFGFSGADLNLATVRPATVDRFDVDVRITDVTLVGCATNPLPSTSVPIQLSLNKFNDGTPGGTGDFTGDHFGRLLVIRQTTFPDPAQTFRVQLGIFRCENPACTVITSPSDGLVTLPEQVRVGQPFELRLAWDAAGNRFVGSVNGHRAASIAYPPDLDQGPARVPFATIAVRSVGASCASVPGVADSAIELGVVRTNPEAVIP
jgi:hypothetical protein